VLSCEENKNFRSFFSQNKTLAVVMQLCANVIAADVMDKNKK
jgi:hypothetical protein